MTSSEFKVVRIRECASDFLAETPERVHEFWMNHVPSSAWWMEDKEIMVLFTMNSRNRITGMNLVSIGTLDTLLVHPREVYRPAIMASASAIVIAHCHPSGDPTPSEADIKVTLELIRAGQLLKIELLDHLVIGKPSPERSKPYTSLKELGCFYS